VKIVDFWLKKHHFTSAMSGGEVVDVLAEAVESFGVKLFDEFTPSWVRNIISTSACGRPHDQLDAHGAASLREAMVRKLKEEIICKIRPSSPFLPGAVTSLSHITIQLCDALTDLLDKDDPG
jgi:hypothetical protein